MLVDIDIIMRVFMTVFMRVTHIRSMDVGGYRHNYEGFYEGHTHKV